MACMCHFRQLQLFVSFIVHLRVIDVRDKFEVSELVIRYNAYFVWKLSGMAIDNITIFYVTLSYCV